MIKSSLKIEFCKLKFLCFKIMRQIRLMMMNKNKSKNNKKNNSCFHCWKLLIKALNFKNLKMFTK